MIAIHYPPYNFNLKEQSGQRYIFDGIRKKWLLLTEEEWVRQNFVRYLVGEMQYPASVIAIEKMLLLNELKKRFDILVYNKHHRPWMLVECKAPQIHLDEAVLQQVLRYNISIPVPYLVITNGPVTYAWEKEHRDLKMLNALPTWQ